MYGANRITRSTTRYGFAYGVILTFLGSYSLAHSDIAGRLTTALAVGIFNNMPATLLYRFREDFADGAIMEAVVWGAPMPVAGSAHPYKSRLFYDYPGRRVIGYDNERGKGDHRHILIKRNATGLLRPSS